MDLPKVPAPARLSRRAIKALASEANRYPGGSHILIIGEDPHLTDYVSSSLANKDNSTLVVLAPDPLAAVSLRARLALLPVAVAERVSILAESTATESKLDKKHNTESQLEASADVVIIAATLPTDSAMAVTKLSQYQRFVRPGGVLSVATRLGSGKAVTRFLENQDATLRVRTETTLGGLPPVRVDHLRVGAVDTTIAAQLTPITRSSQVPLLPKRNPEHESERNGIDINGVVAAGLLGGVAALTKAIAPRSKTWLLPAIAALPVAAFFRDPARLVPNDQNAIVAAADGKVLAVEHVTDDRFGDEKFLRIAVFLSVLDVHINRSPVAGRVVDVVQEEGGYANASSPDAEHNVAQYTVLETSHGRVVIAQRSGLIARRIVNRAKVGAVLAQGERYGLIRFGSRTDIYLPASHVTALVAPEDRVVGGESVIARWN